MADYFMQVTAAMNSGLPIDYSTNTWYFSATDSLGRVDAEEAIKEFYVDVSPLFSSLVHPTASSFKTYDMADPKPRVPVNEGGMGVWTPGATTSPTEVALVLSYQAVPVAGLPQARRRGRVYIGPLAGDLISSTGYVLSTKTTILATAAETLKAASDAAANWTWMQYSTTNDLCSPVDNGWVDNEFDTQRRRGRRAFFRDTWS